MIGYRPHPSLLGGNGGGSGGSGVDQTARDAVAASDAVNTTQATEIDALKAADTAFETRVAAGETKDGTQDSAIAGLQTADTALAGRATALEGRAASGEAKDTAQDADLVAHAARMKAGEDKDVVQDADLATLHGTDTTLAGRATALEGRATAGEAKDVTQDADIVAHGTRLTSGETKNAAQDTDLAGLHMADTALGNRATNLESRATAGETKDSAQDTAIAGNTSRIGSAETKNSSQDTRLTNIENNLATGGLSKLAAVRIKTSQTGWDVVANAPAKATHYEIVAIGGGASGVSSGTASAMAALYPKGGFPGAKRSSARRPINSETLDIVVGAGGASVNAAPNASTTAYLQSAGSDTTVSIKKAGSLLARVAAAGGLLYSAAAVTNARPELASFLMAAPCPPVAGVGLSGDVRNVRACDAQNAFDVPTGGGGANSAAAYGSVLAGKGGDVLYTAGLALHAQDRGNGGIGGSYIDNSGSQFRPGAAGVNPTPDTAETYGSGGGGAGIGNDSGTNTGAAGGNGGFPGGGGGGAWKCPSGAGADGCVDVVYYGLAG